MSKKQERVICRECGLDGAIKNMHRLELYDTPWEDKATTEYVHKHLPTRLKKHHYLKYVESCGDLLFDGGWGDFRYFTCPDCDRTICEQNPANGWHIQYRRVDDEQICLRCFEKTILANGIPREDFEAGKLTGMFFSTGNSEPLEAGYQVVEGFDDKRIASEQGAQIVCHKALELIDLGYKVVVGYESMAIGGLE